MDSNNISNKISLSHNERASYAAFVFWLFGAVGLFFINQVTAHYVFKHGNTLTPHFFGLFPFKNYNFAFSLPVPLSLMYVIYSAVVVGVIVYVVTKYRTISFVHKLGWFLITAGALSNIAERIFFGFVHDYIYVYGGGIFNLADLYIIVGILLLVIKTTSKK